MTSAWLARDWQEVVRELEQSGVRFSYRVTGPRGRNEASGKYRVVRVKNDGDLQFVLAREKFSLRPKSTP